MKRKKFLCLIFILMIVSGILTVSSFATEDIPINEENFPNSYFLRFVKDNFDKDGNGMLSEAEIKAVTKINCSGQGFSTMEGIEFFTELTSLNCSYNHLISLDLSKNTELLELDCSRNDLTSLDISQNTEMRELDCSNNQLTSLDISKNTNLTKISLSFNDLTSLDVSNNRALTEIVVYDNQLADLDVSNNKALKSLTCHYNQLTSLDVGNNTLLEQLTCSGNHLSSLDVSRNADLIRLECSENKQISSLDVSNNKHLDYLGCSGNLLPSLDVSNNRALTYLDCAGNLLTSLNVSSNKALKILCCDNNQISSLDINENTCLTTLNCSENHISFLDVSGQTELTKLSCFDNSLTSLDLNKNTKLTDLFCYNNQISTLDLSKAPELIKIAENGYLDEKYPSYNAYVLNKSSDWHSMNLYYLSVDKGVTIITKASLPFVDVFESDDYYDAVLWAYYADPQVTNGMDETHFGPQLTVTRGQCVTFLWRSQGCPEPATTDNPFEDVSSTEYYYKPILWAVENGITKGVDATHFNPMDTLSTQHIVTFLYRTKNSGMDGWNGEAATWAGQDFDGKPFGVNIAVNNTTDCPRADVVLFLYRCNGQSSFDQQYWVIFTEGYRGNRVEAATIDSTLSSDKLRITWDTKLELNDLSGSGKCDQYFLNKDNKWVKMGKYDRFSENATKILASNLDVYDKDGNLILEKTAYEDVDWEMIKSYK